MSKVFYLQNRHQADHYSQSFLLLSVSSHAKLYEQLAKTLYYMLVEKNDPVVIYQRFPEDVLRLVYAFPPERLPEPVNCSVAQPSDSPLTYQVLKGKHEILGYVGCLPSTHAESSNKLEALLGVASHQWRLLNARYVAEQQMRLKASRIFLYHYIHRFSNIEEMLEHHGLSWCEMFRAKGMSLAYRGAFQNIGHCPPQRELFQRLALLATHPNQADIVEFDHPYQGTLGVQLKAGNRYYGWLFLFREQPLVTQTIMNSDPYQRLSAWLACEAGTALRFATDLTGAIIELEANGPASQTNDFNA